MCPNCYCQDKGVELFNVEKKNLEKGCINCGYKIDKKYNEILSNAATESVTKCKKIRELLTPDSEKRDLILPKFDMIRNFIGRKPATTKILDFSNKFFFIHITIFYYNNRYFFAMDFIDLAYCNTF